MQRRYAIDDEERRVMPVSLKMKPSQHETLQKHCSKNGRSKTYVIEKALELYFNKIGNK